MFIGLMQRFGPFIAGRGIGVNGLLVPWLLGWLHREGGALACRALRS
ncbi:hypothetical protein EDD52_10167 [Primorskyibacter sedentarius]|uniref:Uncharacterized protein n=1 Tax=Primorskyibacter sedentarius TaxID=745311 RepID=A0A4R3JKV0_9RHOB|nr:hypothetical protein EDD52_10167 [Primorskyibacter sedentarius]